MERREEVSGFSSMNSGLSTMGEGIVNMGRSSLQIHIHIISFKVYVPDCYCCVCVDFLFGGNGNGNGQSAQTQCMYACTSPTLEGGRGVYFMFFYSDMNKVPDFILVKVDQLLLSLLVVGTVKNSTYQDLKSNTK